MRIRLGTWWAKWVTPSNWHGGPPLPERTLQGLNMQHSVIQTSFRGETHTKRPPNTVVRHFCFSYSHDGSRCRQEILPGSAHKLVFTPPESLLTCYGVLPVHLDRGRRPAQAVTARASHAGTRYGQEAAICPADPSLRVAVVAVPSHRHAAARCHLAGTPSTTSFSDICIALFLGLYFLTWG